ncbi:sugar ABC transporter substrate-binding protein [Roseomonas sp. OT10]|uniref:ABC transporter substrate-binding protein n=1 Tax=Roseomonas cutis TaxID=2897332 RepID=UPI001E498DA4|nr:sugar ABC transporter substrate-binding protein [Roseomonas sp. OT10]UFN48994.1 sugar ABC transporter substrate-binding protein [Roseomonas sp. OT10]
MSLRHLPRRLSPGLPALALLAGLGAGLTAAPDARAQGSAQCPGGPVTLTVLKPQNNPLFPNQIAAYEAANPCVEFEVSEVPFGQLADKISVLAASGSPPDILVYDGPNTQSYALAGILEPLDAYITPEIKADILPASLTEHSFNGRIYSPGLQQTTLALFYNRNALRAAGITEDPPRELSRAWSWDQALEAFKKCQQGEGDNVSVWGLAPSRFGTGQPGFVYRDMLFLRTFGDPNAPKESSAYRTYWGISPDGKTAQGWLNTPEAVQGAKFFQDLFNVAKVTPRTGIPTAFQDGKACFTIDTSYFVAGLRRPDLGFEWGVTPMPYARSPIVHTGSLTLGVTARSAHKEAAVRAVMAFSTGQFALDYARSSGILPVMQSIVPQVPALSEYPLDIFMQELREWGQPRPPSPRFAQYDKLVSDALRDIAFGADPKTRLDAAVRSLQPLLAR